MMTDDPKIIFFSIDVTADAGLATRFLLEALTLGTGTAFIFFLAGIDSFCAANICNIFIIYK
jgi:hypothetical protein